MRPDYQTAAIRALELLRDMKVEETPIQPLSILLKYPGVRVMSFSGFADEAHTERDNLIHRFGQNQDAATFKLNMDMDDVKYVIVYNMHLPHVVMNRAIARELGHIVLGHDGQTRPSEVRRAEAMCFAHNLMSPRPIIYMLQKAGIPITMEVLARTTGCSYECVDGIQDIPAVTTPKELNRQVKELFEKGIGEYIRFHNASNKQDHSPIVDFGSFMEGYEE